MWSSEVSNFCGNVGMLDSAKIFRTGKTLQLIETKSFTALEGGLQHGQPQFLKLILLKPFCHFFEKKIFLSKIEKEILVFFNLSFCPGAITISRPYVIV